jgi:hypothetical protein
LFLEQIKEYLKSWACGGRMSDIFVGDHYEAASPSDPSFWVMHPTLERLTHAKLLSGGFDDETWATDAETEFVCAKGSCYKEDLDDTDYYPDCCYGHYENDRMYNGFVGSRDEYFGSTNAEMLTATDARSSNYSVNYVYDKFDWSHCPSDYDIDALLVTLYEESLVDSSMKDSTTTTAAETKVTRNMNSHQMHINTLKHSMASVTKSIQTQYKALKAKAVAAASTSADAKGDNGPVIEQPPESNQK